VEVYHPHHPTHKKKWSEYLLEFFMLFLAVSLGFLAENIRERQTEKKVEVQLIHSLIEDLKADTAAFSLNATFWTNRVSGIDSLRHCLQPNNEKVDVAKTYYWAAGSFSFTDFRYHNGTIQQLRNGSFRLIENRTVIDSLVEYDGAVTSYFFNVETAARNEFFVIRHMQSSLFNSAYLEQFFNLYDSNRFYIPDSLITLSKNFTVGGTAESRFEFYNELYNYDRLGRVLISADGQLKDGALRLMKLVQKEYHLENE
jgi:hypothetical protein